MSRLIPCPHPHKCGSSRHPEGSPQARYCPERLDPPSDLSAPTSGRFYPNGQVSSVEWRTEDGTLHRENGPASISFHSDGSVSQMEYVLFGYHSRVGAPAITEYDDQGFIWRQEFWQDGKPISSEGYPSIMEYGPNGLLSSTTRLDENGDFHSYDKPAFVTYYESGAIKLEEWFARGTPHRTNGPARTAYNEDGSIEFTEYWISGRRVDLDTEAKIIARESDSSRRAV